MFRRLPLALRASLAALVLPGVLVYLIPWLLAGSDRSPINRDWWHWLGTAFIGLGLIGLGSSIIEFARRGRGTLAPIDPPSQLVRGGLYQVTRNPMYCANVASLAGQSLLYGSAAVAVYSILVTLAFHAFVVLYEEPALLRAFGPSWSEYANRVPRWVGVRRAR